MRIIKMERNDFSEFESITFFEKVSFDLNPLTQEISVQNRNFGQKSQF